MLVVCPVFLLIWFSSTNHRYSLFCLVCYYLFCCTAVLVLSHKHTVATYCVNISYVLSCFCVFLHSFVFQCFWALFKFFFLLRQFLVEATRGGIYLDYKISLDGGESRLCCIPFCKNLCCVWGGRCIRSSLYITSTYLTLQTTKVTKLTWRWFYYLLIQLVYLPLSSPAMTCISRMKHQAKISISSCLFGWLEPN